MITMNWKDIQEFLRDRVRPDAKKFRYPFAANFTLLGQYFEREEIEYLYLYRTITDLKALGIYTDWELFVMMEYVISDHHDKA